MFLLIVRVAGGKRIALKTTPTIVQKINGMESHLLSLNGARLFIDELRQIIWNTSVFTCSMVEIEVAHLSLGDKMCLFNVAQTAGAF